MNKSQALDLLTLLSAIESWALSQKENLPDYLSDRIVSSSDMLRGIVLDEPAQGKPDENEWIPWVGGGCPVDQDTRVRVKFQDGEVTAVIPAGFLRWSRRNGNRDIVAYRIVGGSK